MNVANKNSCRAYVGGAVLAVLHAAGRLGVGQGDTTGWGVPLTAIDRLEKEIESIQASGSVAVAFGVEVDVMLCARCGQPRLLWNPHSAFQARVCQECEWRESCVSQRARSGVRSRHAGEVGDVRLLSVSQLVRELSGRALPLSLVQIDIKAIWSEYAAARCAALVIEELRSIGQSNTAGGTGSGSGRSMGRLEILSAWPEACYEARRYGWPSRLTCTRAAFFERKRLESWAVENGCDVLLEYPYFTKALLDDLNARGVGVMCGVCDSAVVISELIGWGVRVFSTNELKAVVGGERLWTASSSANVELRDIG